jgi:hypothetical protein
MKRFRLPLISLFTLLTSALLARSGWLSPPSDGLTSQTPLTRAGNARSHSSLSSETLWRWQSGQPHHWRSQMLQH